MTSTPCFRFVQRVAKAFLTAGGHDSVTLKNLEIVKAQPGHVQASLKIAKTNLNRIGTVHGGLICTLVDTMGSLALASKGMYATGVSTDISTTFAKAAGKTGDVVLVDAKLTSMGRSLATTRIELRNPTSDNLLAFGSHTKYIANASKHEENVTFDESGESITSGKQPEEWKDVSL